ncbi:LHFPL tetraspan subfamily member 2 protein-like [Saccoglossus kowalevskii]|uniref:Lipoma HMGIC fusion partner-like 2 protein-like n=1 Tax=Saccoglossus kowalevskii TaxID=10224 RepID=A0ABM0GZY1_SACKO|nr:PREDICTED: lipoma HMGIC fusion partner-like 2 protein-like [Saccoglossus kowalevskii]
MCYVIMTCRSLLWTLLSLAAALAMSAAVITPQWLIGKPQKIGLSTDDDLSTRQYSDLNDDYYTPSIGIYNRCTKLHKFEEFVDNCATYVNGFSELPSNYWKASTVFLAIGLLLLCMVVMTSVFSCCIRSLCKKSIFTISGLLQAIAGLFLILGLVLYPAGWGAPRIKELCGEDAGAFQIGDCHPGWAFYTAIGATCLAFVCAVLSIQADASTSSDKVQSEILEGKNLICLP